jgi:membrane associated rhomboid family serine protease
LIVEVQRRTRVQQMPYEDFERRIRDGEIDARTPVRFELVTGTEFVPAGDLELFQALADPRRMAFRKNLLTRGVPIITALLVGVQIRIYLTSWSPDTDLWLQETFTNWAPAIYEQGEVWRLLTYGLLHVSFTHLLFNLCFLAYVGYHLERAIGRSNLLLLYFGSVFAGGLLSITMAPDRPSLGASGGIFGLIAAAVVVGWKHWESIPIRARKYFGWALAPYLGFSILSGIQAENVDNWSHFGGLLAGVALVTILEPEALVAKGGGNRRRRWATIGLIGLLALGVGRWGGWLIPLEQDVGTGWVVERPVYWGPGWTFTGDRGWFSPTLQATLSATTTVHPRPLTADEAADSLIERIGSGSRDPEVRVREHIELGQQDARRLVLRFDLSGEEQEVIAFVTTRGVFEHRVQFQSVAARSGTYAPLVRRIAESVRFAEVEELAQARNRAALHPRSAEPAVELGDALYRTGDPEGALRAYAQALTIDADRLDALRGQLRVFADYEVGDGASAARAALAQHPATPRIIVAAADALETAGHRDEAIAALDAAWLLLPGDRALRRARRRWGLSAELPDAPAPASP